MSAPFDRLDAAFAAWEESERALSQAHADFAREMGDLLAPLLNPADVLADPVGADRALVGQGA